MPTVTPNQRKWLAHLAGGNPIVCQVNGTYYTGAGGGRIVKATVDRMLALDYVKLRDGSWLNMTERGRLALAAAEVTTPMLNALRKAAGGDEIPRSKQNTVGALYELAFINDRLKITDRGRQALALIES